MLSAILEIALINGSIVVEVLSPAIFLAFDPLAFVLVLIGIPHGALALFYIVLPITFINIAVRIPVSSPALFTIFDATFV